MKDKQSKEIKYLFATMGSLTERGGRVTTATGGGSYCGLGLACVGDVMTYADGSEAAIMDGAGFMCVMDGRPAALVGSSLSNGDRIVETLWKDAYFTVPEGETIAGLFDSDYVPPPDTAQLWRFAVIGATTRRGGVLHEVTGTFEVRDTSRNAACTGDFIEYSDGTRAQIITGVGLPDSPHFKPLAVVGSMLDNGDVITDSPHRNGHATSFVPMYADVVAATHHPITGETGLFVGYRAEA
ncbi:PAAR domain-containing protein [Paraburkholderia sediminicola]|uniref:PAAR domain-containing protein n=1 Tax=Paraburkholderia sediminicola TaxID=458836 RepID=UPI0038BA6504